ncbi:hypothetical protein [Thalassospira xiamenensis]|uniref:hypothetical protein n=1 Tax=Thalassospira xiamenensis TaxID=220697 RepID=UPI001E458310|nr:hypothetical protein [Thalassospira xiamenensis]MCD1593372.1 hypothetical protein [Thalassospira xiamenensis]
MTQDIDKKSDGTRTSTIHKMIVAITVMMVALMAILGMQIEELCTPVPLDFPACRQLLGLEWETLATGLMSLMAGLMVFFSASDQVRATRQTGDAALRQAKLHRADEINAPLQLAYDVINGFSHWLEGTSQHLRNLDENADTTSGISSFVGATGRAHQELGRRCLHVRKIRDQHIATSFNYTVSERITSVCDIMEFDPSGHYTHTNNQDINGARQRMTAINEARTRVAGARTEIMRQITQNRARCGVED